MKAALLLALALSIPALAGAATVDPTEAWKPMHSFIGTWKGTRTGAKVTRVYSSAPTNHHLEITEKGAGVWGIVSFDAQREVLVLRQFGADGTASDAAFDPAASTGDQLVFASADTRITYERSGWNAFVERIERAAAGAPFTVVSETRFERKN